MKLPLDIRPKWLKTLQDAEKAPRLSGLSILLEDRENDWLAKQLREESNAKFGEEMLDLGAAHERECAAEKLKNEHHRNCAAEILKNLHRISCDADGIDTGETKS